ncbi:O-antigen ligase [Chromobacterium sp. IIBBL 290-4]|uniref:O-antigen ligase family protein n=1 Tax=Chromobacterium sp. IIBBL 290-4 TaxID=2953890 RepID=UPI0020B89735|nr:O-antigen ligase family protein [Chromobacterium sp. IIBBL 290-4]UTH75283.1 O-antigen ligase family protein [Chromobacterium sp. IIBBL 290-4]
MFFSKDQIYDLLVGLLLFFILAMGFVWRGSAPAASLLLALLGFGTLFVGRNYFKPCWDLYKPWVIGMSALGLAILVRLLIDLNPRTSYADSATRLMVAIPVFAAICCSRRLSFHNIRWMLPVAVLSMLLFGISGAEQVGDDRIHTAFTNTIPFAAFCLLFAVSFFIYSFGRSRLDSLFSVMVALVAVTVIYLSQARGVWIATLAVLAYVIFSHLGFSWKKLCLMVVAIPVILIAVYHQSPMVQYRVHKATAEYSEYFAGKKDGSVSMRMDMASASYHIYTEHPVFGVGRDIVPTMQDLYHRGIVGKAVSDAVDTHAELFYNAASLGTVGLLVYVMFYFGVTLPYVRALKSSLPDIVKIGRAGVAGSIVFFFVGFTHITLGLVMYASIYAVFQAVLLASLYKLSTAISDSN